MREISKNISKIDLMAALPQHAHFGEVVYEPGGECGPRVQRDIQAVIVDHGSARVAVDGRRHGLGPGDLICLWPGGFETFDFDPRRATTHRWVALSLREVDRMFTHSEATSPAPLLAVETPEQRAIFAAGYRVQPAARAGADPVLVHLGLAYFAGMLSEYFGVVPDEPINPSHPAVVAAMRAIQQRFDEPLTLGDLADAASVTPSHLVRLFRRHTDKTPMRTLWETRVARGAELLRETGLSVSEVAYRVGFSNPYHFSRLTRKQLGLSPSAWRKRAWGGADRTQ